MYADKEKFRKLMIVFFGVIVGTFYGFMCVLSITNVFLWILGTLFTLIGSLILFLNVFSLSIYRLYDSISLGFMFTWRERFLRIDLPGLCITLFWLPLRKEKRQEYIDKLLNRYYVDESLKNWCGSD